jgi:hypothetical protein
LHLWAQQRSSTYDAGAGTKVSLMSDEGGNLWIATTGSNREKV